MPREPNLSYTNETTETFDTASFVRKIFIRRLKLCPVELGIVPSLDRRLLRWESCKLCLMPLSCLAATGPPKFEFHLARARHTSGPPTAPPC